MLRWVAALAIALLAVLLQYAWRAPAPARFRWPLILLRGVAALLIAALLLDAPAGLARPPAPFVALDASASWRRGGDTALWRTARGRAAAVGADSSFLFGDSLRAGGGDSLPHDRASRVRPAVDRALAAGRRLLVVTDGELDDGDALAALPAGSRVEVVARATRPDAALTALALPRSAVAGDTIELSATVTAGGSGSAAGSLRVLVGDRVASELPLGTLAASASRTVPVRVRPEGEGPVLVRVVVATAGDAEPRNDTLAAALDVSPSAGAVLVSTAPDYDARYALAVLRGAVRLPTRAFFRVAPGQWRVDPTLSPVSEAEVRRAAAAAPLLVLHGDTSVFGAPRSTGAGALLLFAPPRSTGDLGADEWYATGAPASPVSGALAGVPWDSLSPLDVSPVLPPHEWEGLETRRARRLESRVAIGGSERPRRTVIIAASGLWRWQFRGGVSADAYQALLGGIFDWLAAERADRRAALPEAAYAREGEPLRWRRGGPADSVVTVALARRGAPARTDSLVVRFGPDRSVAETAPLAAGVYDVRTRGGASLLVVNASREWLPRAPGVRSGRIGGAAPAGAAPGLRAHGLAYLLAVLALCGEWLLRRRAGLR